MSFVFTKFQQILRHGIITNRSAPVRYLTRGTVFRCEEVEEGSDSNKKNEKIIDASKDRRKLVSVETSIRYLKSDAFKKTYANYPVWKLYRRNHKGSIPPRKTRRTCIRQGIITTGSPCPICRDEYLILDHRNVDLLKQFISEFNGEVLSYNKTGLCQRQHNNLLVAISRAKNYGLLTYDVPIREYDYSEWYQAEEKNL